MRFFLSYFRFDQENESLNRSAYLERELHECGSIEFFA